MSTSTPERASRVTDLDDDNFTTSGSEGTGRRVRRSKRISSARKSSSRTVTTAATSSSSSQTQTQTQNGHLQVPSSSPGHREPSRSPSPLGIIPIHSQFRSFIHRHEIPRKALHVSIGFLTLSLYAKGYQISQIHPVLLTALVPVATVDVLRHNFPSLNAIYVKALGALMRESEVHGYNGVIWYLAGTWAVLRFFPKDVGVMGVLLLSWCDTAASTFGRAWGRYTWRVRRGKSAAGSAAALVTGIVTAWIFWGWAVPTFGAPNGYDAPPHSLAYQGRLGLPTTLKNLIGWKGAATISGAVATGVLSLWTGAVASASEAIDIFGWDDNFTIPVLCGVGLWGFLKVFGDA